MRPTKRLCPVIGLLGGIASGKTTVARMLARLGARVVDADAIGHAALAEPAVRQKVIERWGSEVVGPDGNVDRAALARKVFADPAALAALEAITHPAILAEMRRQVEAARRDGAPAVVVDAPLLTEAGLAQECDVLAFVECPLETRLARAAERGWHAEELLRRESLQRPLELKRATARVVIDGSASLETTFLQVQELWQETLAR